MNSDKRISGILLSSPASAVLGNKCVPFACSFCSALIAFHYSNGVAEHDEVFKVSKLAGVPYQQKTNVDI